MARRPLIAALHTEEGKRRAIEELARALEQVEGTGGGAVAGTVMAVSADTALPATDNLIVLASLTGPVTLSLPAAGDMVGKAIVVKLLTNTGDALTVDTFEAIDGAASVVLSVQYQSRTFVSDGNDWYLV